METTMIEAYELSKRYKGIEFDRKENGIGLWVKNLLKLTSNKASNVLALNKVSFKIHQGEIIGIYGENGAGKTTLIKILSGLVNADSGNLMVNGSSNNRDIKNAISYISTNGWMGLEWQLTAKENLMLYGNIYGMKQKELEERCEFILKLVGMEENQNKYISQLSAGMRQKITIARGLLIDKPILYFDEPTVSLDVNSANQFRKIIKQISDGNKKTTLITSHVPDDLVMCDRLMFLYKGEIIALGRMEELGQPFQNKKVLTLKCMNYHEDMTRLIKDCLGVYHISVNLVNGKDYRMIKISIDHDLSLVNKIVDLLIDHHITILDMNLSDNSLKEIYEYYVELSL